LPVQLKPETFHAPIHIAGSRRRARRSRNRDVARQRGRSRGRRSAAGLARDRQGVVEVPSPWNGRIARLFGGQGDLIQGGTRLVECAEGAQGDTGTVVGELGQEEKAARAEAPTPALARTLQVLPAVRALARKLDVDLNLVQASGPGGTITRADVERAAKSLAEAGRAEPLRGMRRAMAQRMAAAHAEVVRTTVNDEADIDDWQQREDVTIRIVRAIASACQAEPSLNAWYNAE